MATVTKRGTGGGVTEPRLELSVNRRHDHRLFGE